MGTLRIGTPAVRTEAGHAVWEAPVESPRGETPLWFRVEAEHAGLLSTESDAALLALLLPAMAAGEDIEVEGSVSERLWYHLSGRYQRLLGQVIPWLGRVTIRPARLRRGGTRPPGVAAGFSAGIDSWSLVADHHARGDIPDGFRLTHLLFNDVGSHGPPGLGLFQPRLARIRPVADRLGLPLVPVASNLAAHYDRRLSFIQTHTPRNASVALLLQGGVGRFLYAASYRWADSVVGPSPGIARTDPTALPMLGTESLDAHSVGGEYSRVEKTLQVAELPASWDALDVCTRPSDGRPNCSRCSKCVRTLLTLEIAGLADRYASAFHLDEFRRGIGRSAAKVLGDPYPLNREIAEFARARGYRFPVRARLASATRLLWRRLGRLRPGRGPELLPSS